MNFEETYSRKEFQNFLKAFLSDEFTIKDEVIALESPNDKIQNITLIGQDPNPKFNLNIYEIIHESENDPRVTLSKEVFIMMKKQGLSNALAIFKSQNSKEYRFSYLTIDVEFEDGKVKSQNSNPRRYSFLLGPNAKIHTPKKFLSGKITDLDDLKARFSIEVVNKQFYSEISKLFSELVEKVKLPSVSDEKTKQKFAVRLIARIIFSWFLKNKKSKNSKPLIPEEILSFKAVEGTQNYYHEILEPLFFELMNTQKDKRHSKFKNAFFDDIPFLNGGLFEPKNDYYDFEETVGYSKYFTLMVPNDWIESFFKVLESYNFTIDENTPVDIELSVDPEMLGRIFENLLAEINPETKESARKSTGSYYTPREIVDYMVDEALKRYLMDKALINEKEIEDLLTYHEDTIKMNEDEKAKIISAIDELKVIDPACGSGAFLMGTLQKLSWILQKVDPDAKKWKEKQLQNVEFTFREQKLEGENAEFIHKLGIIERTIYGVDIQEIAVEISKLRVFLSLVVEANVSDIKENRGIKPLPNLEFKFICANTLKELPGLRTNNQIYLENYETINELKKLRGKYFISYGKRKKEIEDEFKQVQKKMLMDLDFKPGTLDTQASMLSLWDPFSTKSSSWFNTEWMFGIEDGFDVVISNPPYIQLQKDQGKLAKMYKDQNFETYARTGDIYMLFYERGMELLKEKGHLCFITSNKWMRAQYGEKLRTFFLKQNPRILIDLGAGVFESSTVDTNILLVQKTRNENQLKGVTLKSKDELKDLSNFVDKNEISLSNMNKNTWFIGNGAEIRLKEKIEKIGIPLKDWDVHIYRGILTGLNEAFIINSKKREEILSNCKDEDERKRTEAIIKPILRGRDIKRYSYKWAELWSIFIPWHFPLHEDKTIQGTSKEAESLFLTSYPAIYNHFLQYREKLLRRNKDETGIRYEWYALQRCANTYYSELEKEKVVWQRITQEPTFCSVESDIFILDSMAFFTGENLKYIMAILNSKIIYEYVKMIVHQYGFTGFRLSNQYVDVMPIPPIIIQNKSIVEQIETLVDEILSVKKSNPDTDTNSYEHQIDQLVYKLYDLTDEEIEIVENISNH